MSAGGGSRAPWPGSEPDFLPAVPPCPPQSAGARPCGDICLPEAASGSLCGIPCLQPYLQCLHLCHPHSPSPERTHSHMQLAHTRLCTYTPHVHMHTHTCTGTHTTRTRLDACVHSTHTCTHMHRHTRAGCMCTQHTHVCTRTHVHRYTHAWIYIYTHVRTQTRMHRYTHHTCLDMCAHYTHVYTHAHVCTGTHHTNMPGCMCTHITHTHIRVCVCTGIHTLKYMCVHIMHIRITHAHLPRYTPHACPGAHAVHTCICVHTLHSHMCVYTIHMHVFTCTHHYTCACSHIHIHAFLHTLPCPPERTPTLPGCPGSGPVALLRPHHTARLLSLLITQGRAAHHTPSPAGPSSPGCFPMQAPQSRPHSSRLPRQRLCSRRPSTAKTLHSWRASILSRPLRSSLAAPVSVRTFWLSLGVPVPPPPPTPRGRLGSESELHRHSLPAQGPGFSLLPFVWRCHSLGGLSTSGPAVCLKAGHLTSLGLNSHTSGQGRWTLPQLCPQPWRSHCTQAHKALWPACWGLVPSFWQGGHGPSLKTPLGWKRGGVPKT